uniref:Reverse transcriptase domain-containing protein n=1 Tax=Bracon brevicornis TaxID=1563983 RepID=A0A6V7JLV8_9HYME
MPGILDELRQAHYLTTLDLSQAYFQVPLSKESREITAFIVPGRGFFQFKRVPFGLMNAPATFQRLIDKLIGPQMYPHVFVYVGDIIIVTRTYDEHLVWLRRVLQKIRNTGLVINRERNEFSRSQVKYLGFLVNQSGLQADPEETSAIVDFPAPQTMKQLKRFSRMASWYRRFIPTFASIAEPLTEQQDAFELLKSHLTAAPTLACPDFNQPFVLQTEASTVGLDAVLTQVQKGEERVITYASRALTDPEKNYTTTEQECLAAIWAIREFRCYLEGYSFTVITDHNSLRWLHQLRDPTGRLARWSLESMEYNVEIIHRKGALHHVPDALSRIPKSHFPEGAFNAMKLEDYWTTTDDQWYRKRRADVLHRPAQFSDWQVENNHLYFHRQNKLHDGKLPDLAWKLVVPRE